MSRRLDLWLFFARFAKSRSLAARWIESGAIRVNGKVAAKPAQAVAIGDVVVFARGQDVIVARVEAEGQRRGPAEEARQLYHLIEA